MPLLTPHEAVVGASDSPETIVDRMAEHVSHGARAVGELDLPDSVAKAVATHHERWNGAGYPRGLSGDQVPQVGRIIGLADIVESLIDQTTPLLARRNFAYWLSGFSDKECDSETVEALRMLGAGDSFWLGLFSSEIETELNVHGARLREPKAMRVIPFTESFARLVDSRFAFTVGVSARVSRYAESLGRVAGLADVRLKQLQIAALLHDVGQLSMSERVLSKPGILSVEELGALHLHPIYSRDVVAGIGGLEEVAEWVESHHERIDGRGYPEGRSGDEIPLESRILAIADAYVAMTSDRPHPGRRQKVIRRGSGWSMPRARNWTPAWSKPSCGRSSRQSECGQRSSTLRRSLILFRHMLLDVGRHGEAERDAKQQPQ